MPLVIDFRLNSDFLTTDFASSPNGGFHCVLMISDDRKSSQDSVGVGKGQGPARTSNDRALNHCIKELEFRYWNLVADANISFIYASDGKGTRVLK